MKETAEFRIPESYAQEFLSQDDGEKIMGFVRKIKVPVNSGLYKKIGDIYELVKSRDQDYFFLGWEINRKYSKEELESANLVLVNISKTFEPAGIECGTIYSSKNTCEICGSGSQQLSDLFLDINKIPKSVNIARTISNEIVVDQEFAGILNDNKLRGYELKPVHHKGSRSTSNSKMIWYQLSVASSVRISGKTKTGISPFDVDENNTYRCKNGHTVGLNILSELFIEKDSWDGSDIVATEQMFGVNRGLLHTYPLLLISQKLYKLMKALKCKGYKVEVVNLVD